MRRHHVLLFLALTLITATLCAQPPDSSTADTPATETSEASERQAPAPEGALTLESISVTPEKLTPDTLCQLRVTIRNDGERIASQLAFEVTVEDNELPVYRNQLFMDRLDPGEATEVRLYNFWTNETGRPVPTDGDLEVEVALTEATWYRIQDIEEDGETIEEWTPLEPVSGLPLRQRVKLPFSRSGHGETTESSPR